MTSLVESARYKVLFCDPFGGYLNWPQSVKASGAKWDIDRIDALSAALELLKARHYDAVVVASLSAPDRELGFLRDVMAKHSDCARILYAPSLSPKLLSRSLDVAHRVCTVSEPLEHLVQQVEQSLSSNRSIYSKKVRGSLAAFKQLPSPPAIFEELTRLLNSEQTTASHIAAVVSKDPALAARVIRVVNSSYFGLPNKVSNIQQAVTLIGVRTLRSLSLAGHLGRHYKELANWTEYSLPAMQTRSLMVARLAQQLARIASRDPLLRDQAFLSGLLLDVGMVMLASEQASSYKKVFSFARKRELEISEVEERAFGVSHAQLGAGLMNQWNLPPLVVDAILYHHNPSDYTEEGLTPVALAHVADALLPPLKSQQGLDLSARLDLAYINANALDEHLPKWKMEANDFRLQSNRNAG